MANHIALAAHEIPRKAVQNILARLHPISVIGSCDLRVRTEQAGFTRQQVLLFCYVEECD